VSVAETRPVDAPARRPAVADWFNTADHKRVGVAMLLTSLAFGAVTAVVAMDLGVESFTEGLGFLGHGKALQYQTLLATSAFYLFLLPAFLGLAVYVVPLQIGARRAAFPRLHQFAYWLYFGGGVVVVASYLVDDSPYSAHALLRRPMVTPAGDASALWLLGMGAVVIALLVTAAGLVATVTALRAPGMTLDRAPAFTWAAFVASVVLALSLPVFGAGLLLHALNLATSGKLWASNAMGNVWQHTLSIWMRPEILVLLVFVAGAVSEVVAAFARKRLLAYTPALGLIAATGALTFAVWASEKVRPDAPLAPTQTIQAALLYAPLGLLVLMWLGTVALGRPRPSAALVHAAGAVLMLALGLAGGISGLVVDVDGGTMWAQGHTEALLFAPAAFALAAAVYYWAPKIWGRFLDERLGYLQFLALVGGFLLATIPAYTGLRDAERYTVLFSGDEQTFARIATVGTALVVIGFALFVLNVALAAMGRGRVAAADAWDDGATLEWLAPSPPPPWNFTDEEIPPIRSEQPVLDLRTDGPLTRGDA
jgi:cytochrome c oxidase subunit 1